MNEAAEINRLLDRHLAALTERGSPAADLLGPAMDEREIRRRLTEAGYHDRDDVVAFFTRVGWPTDADRKAELFWETSNVPTVDAAIEIQRSAIELAAELAIEGEDQEIDWSTVFPGPPHWLPLLMLDEIQLLSIDCRPDPAGGSLWSLFIESENDRVFDSLAEALETAVFCVESDLWQVEADLINCAGRFTGPGSADRDDPPWAGHGDAPTVRLVVLDPDDAGFLVADAPDGRQLYRVHPSLADGLVANGHDTLALSWAEARRLPPCQTPAFFQVMMDPDGARPDPSLRVAVIEPESIGCYLSISAADSGGPSRHQWLDPEQTAELRDLGFTFEPEGDDLHPPLYQPGGTDDGAGSGAEALSREEIIGLLRGDTPPPGW